MSRTIATAKGLTYDLPQDTLAAQQGQAAIRGGARTSAGQNLDPFNELLKGELYQQEGRTNEYYKKIGALKGFVDKLATAGYDVTKPDITDPQAIEYYTTYQQGLADLQNEKNSLMRDKTMEDFSIQSPDIVREQDEQGNPSFGNVGMNDTAKAFQTSFAQVKSVEELDEVEDARSEMVSVLTEDLMQARDPRERMEIRSSINQLNAMRGGVGMTPYEQESIKLRKQELAQKQQDINKGKGEKSKAQAKIIERFKTISESIATRDLSQLEAATGMSNARIADLASGTFIMFEDSQGNPRKVALDPNNPSKAFKTINGMINQSWDGSAIDSDEMFSVLRENNVDVEGFMENIVSTADVKEDVSEGFMNGAIQKLSSGSSEDINPILNMLRNAEGGLVAPLSLAGRVGIGEEVYINGLEYSDPAFYNPFGTKGIKVTMEDKKGNPKSVMLQPNKPEDLQIIKDMIANNLDDIPRDQIELLLGTNTDINSPDVEDLY